jgi:heat shock protein HslJ
VEYVRFVICKVVVTRAFSQRMKKVFYSSLLIFLLSMFVGAQSLPIGKWRLKEYRSGRKVEKPLIGVDVILNVRSDGKLGGSSGCNVYGGSYATDDGKLQIGDLVSTMRACEEPTPQFEKTFFYVLENAVDARVKDGELVITDADKTRVLRFTLVQK